MTTRTTRVIRTVAIILLAVVTPLIGRTSAPLPMPYKQFTVKGFVHRTGGGSLANIPVVLTTLDSRYPDGYWIMADWSGESRDVALTTPEGEFRLSVKTRQEPVDTIVVAVVFPEGEIYFGEPLVVDSLTFGTHTDTYKIESTGYCKTEDTVEHIAGYLYSIREQSVTIP